MLIGFKETCLRKGIHDTWEERVSKQETANWSEVYLLRLKCLNVMEVERACAQNDEHETHSRILDMDTSWA